MSLSVSMATLQMIVISILLKNLKRITLIIEVNLFFLLTVMYDQVT